MNGLVQRKKMFVLTFLLGLICSIATLFLIVPHKAQAELTCKEGSTLQENVEYRDGLDGVKYINQCVDDKTGLPIPGQSEASKKAPEIVQCQGWLGSNISFGCALASVAVTIFTGFIAVFTTFLDWATAALNAAIKYTVVDFKTWFDYIREPVTNGWTVFRDLSNILIIGFFVFIAISIILGLQEFGQKKLIARVIIVAILINFSFLFTLIAINTSNAVATGIYSQMTVPKTPEGSKEFRGIADQFKNDIGIQSLQNTQNILMREYNSSNGWAGLFWKGILTAIFTLSAALVFLFGAFLLIARYITLVLLLMISAVAFATYLIPSFAEAGWSKWWHELLRNAFLAPIMMLFFAISLGVSHGLSAKNIIGGDANLALGNIISSPADAGTWTLIMSYFSILGILFGGMYIANQMAGGMAKRLVAGAALWPIAAGARYVAAPILRNRLGRGADERAGRLGLNLETERTALAKRMLDEKKAFEAKPENKDKVWPGASKADIAPLTNLIRQQAKAKAKADRSYELANVPGVAPLLKAAGAPDALTKTSKESYAKTAHAEAEAAAKAALGTAMGQEQAQKLAKEQRQGDRNDIQRGHEDNERILKALDEQLDEARRSHNEFANLTQAQSDKTQAIDVIATADRERASGAIDEATHRNRIQAQTAAISRAENAARQAEQAIGGDPNIIALMDRINAGRQASTAFRTQLREFDEQTNALAKTIRDDFNTTVLPKVGDALARKGVTRVLYNVTGVDLSDSQVAHHTRDIITKRAPHMDEAAKKKVLKSFEESSHASTKPAPGGAPHGGGAAHP